MKAPFEFGFIYDPSQRDLKGLLYKNFSLLPKKLISWDKSFLGCFFVSREKELYPLIICNKRWKLCRNLHGLLRSLWKTNVCKVFQSIYIYMCVYTYLYYKSERQNKIQNSWTKDMQNKIIVMVKTKCSIY